MYDRNYTPSQRCKKNRLHRNNRRAVKRQLAGGEWQDLERRELPSQQRAIPQFRKLESGR